MIHDFDPSCLRDILRIEIVFADGVASRGSYMQAAFALPEKRVDARFLPPALTTSRLDRFSVRTKRERSFGEIVDQRFDHIKRLYRPFL